eukprot:7384809-Prymnesium_polylepis.1
MVVPPTAAPPNGRVCGCRGAAYRCLVAGSAWAVWRSESSTPCAEASPAITVDPGRHVPREPNVAGKKGRWRRASPHRAPGGAARVGSRSSGVP